MTEDDRRLSGAYAADAVTDDERVAHEALLRDDAELAEETRSLTEAVSELSKISEQAPPEHLRAEILHAIKSVRPLPPQAPADTAGGTAHDPALPAPVDLHGRRSRRRGAWLGVFAAAAAAIVAVVIVLGQRDGAPANQAQAVISATDVGSRVATVNDWSATLYLSRSQEKAVLASEEMPDAPAGRDFQVWLMHDDGTITSAGIMPHTGGDGQEYLVTGILDDVRMIAVSEEPAGGSAQPTTDPLLALEVA